MYLEKGTQVRVPLFVACPIRLSKIGSRGYNRHFIPSACRIIPFGEEGQAHKYFLISGPDWQGNPFRLTGLEQCFSFL
jgi:hypothetical protein